MIANHTRSINDHFGINSHTHQAMLSRLAEFRKQFPIESGWSLETECAHCDNEKVIFKATIKNPEGRAVATGHAEQKQGDSAFENAETNSIGRALTAAGFIEKTEQEHSSSQAPTVLPVQPEAKPPAILQQPVLPVSQESLQDKPGVAPSMAGQEKQNGQAGQVGQGGQPDVEKA